MPQELASHNIGEHTKRKNDEFTDALRASLKKRQEQTNGKFLEEKAKHNLDEDAVVLIILIAKGFLYWQERNSVEADAMLLVGIGIFIYTFYSVRRNINVWYIKTSESISGLGEKLKQVPPAEVFTLLDSYSKDPIFFSKFFTFLVKQDGKKLNEMVDIAQRREAGEEVSDKSGRFVQFMKDLFGRPGKSVEVSDFVQDFALPLSKEEYEALFENYSDQDEMRKPVIEEFIRFVTKYNLSTEEVRQFIQVLDDLTYEDAEEAARLEASYQNLADGVFLKVETNNNPIEEVLEQFS